MIVKNSTDFHKTQPKQHLSLNQHSRTHSHNSMPNQSKPYFLQGFELAKQFLIQLKKQKISELDYSPIINKNGKISNDTMNLEHDRSSDKNSSKLSKKTTKIQKFRTIPPEDEINENYEAQEQQSIQTMKFKQSTLGKQHQLRKSKQKTQQKNQKQENVSNGQQYDKFFQQENSITDKNNRTSTLPNEVSSGKPTGKQFKKEIQWYQAEINEIGKKLQEVNSQIQNYDIIFDNLCDCYRANQAIVNKNHKLKKQSMRLQSQREQILEKIELIKKQGQEIDIIEKKANDLIKKTVQQYVREVCIYNQAEELQTMKPQRIQSPIIDGDQQENDEQLYTDGLNLNFKKLKSKFDEKQKKKSLLEPKKIAKGVSFQQQIDVITKYYESQLTNI